MQILKILFLLSAITLAASQGLHAGSTFMNGVVLKPWKFSLNACGSFTMVNDDPTTIPDLGVRVGLPGNLDFGIKGFNLGLITDIKYIFMEFQPFRMAVDIELDFASRVAVSGAIIMDLEVSSFLAVYFSARWRYPALVDVDTSYFYSGYPAGMTFLGRFGIEVLRYGFLSFNLEGGIATSWASTMLGYNMGVMITWHIN